MEKLSDNSRYRITKNNLYNEWLEKGNEIRTPALMSSIERKAQRISINENYSLFEIMNLYEEEYMEILKWKKKHLII